jgi:hypothetical protein
MGAIVRDAYTWRKASGWLLWDRLVLPFRFESQTGGSQNERHDQAQAIAAHPNFELYGAGTSPNRTRGYELREEG